MVQAVLHLTHNHYLLKLGSHKGNFTLLNKFQ